MFVELTQMLDIFLDTGITGFDRIVYHDKRYVYHQSSFSHSFQRAGSQPTDGFQQ